MIKVVKKLTGGYVISIDDNVMSEPKFEFAAKEVVKTLQRSLPNEVHWFVEKQKIVEEPYEPA